MQLIKYHHIYNTDKHIKKLLSQLGIKTPKGQGFWNLPKFELEMIFEDAKKQYQNRRISIAPRKYDDDWKAAADLNQLWQAIEKRFISHFNPRLIPRFDNGLSQLQRIKLFRPEKLNEFRRKMRDSSQKRRDDLKVNNPKKYKEIFDSINKRNKARYDSLPVLEKQILRLKATKKWKRWHERIKAENPERFKEMKRRAAEQLRERRRLKKQAKLTCN